MSVRYFIGVDGGGTKTEAVLVDDAGKALGIGVSGSSNRNHFSREQVKSNLAAAIAGALRGASVVADDISIYLGMSAVSTDRDKQEITALVRELSILGESPLVTVDNDAVAGLVGGLAGKPGIVLIAGTGSACLGINAKREQWWTGGWGAMADDAGSAAWVGLRALQAAVRAEDGRAKPTALKEIVFSRLGLADPRELLDRVHNQGLDRNDFGAFAPLVVQACVAGDETAGEILDEAAVELSLLVKTAVSRLFGDESCELIYVGSFARSGAPFQPLLTKKIIDESPNITVREPLLSPSLGAAMEALRLGGVAWTQGLVDTLAMSGRDVAAGKTL